MLEFTTKLNNLIWSVPMMILILGAGSSSLWRPGRDFLDVDRGSDRRSNVFHRVYLGTDL